MISEQAWMQIRGDLSNVKLSVFIIAISLVCIDCPPKAWAYGTQRVVTPI